MRRDFLGIVDAGSRNDTGLRVNFELVALASLDFVAVRIRNMMFLAIDEW
jgi:hypothetical protein